MALLKRDSVCAVSGERRSELADRQYVLFTVNPNHPFPSIGPYSVSLGLAPHDQYERMIAESI